ncbi:APC family permease [Listeria costaricensis]|uniref:APC family permease n=1 Tax=Listeria costaricensis TaxID=2026604 RepID=UPI000C08B0CB|nr:APC family permease [Listeria costaricensis]
MDQMKKLGFIDIVSLSFAAVFSLELIASQASMGPSLIFCFIVLGATFFLSHGLICAELGATYPDQGGIYVWIKRAFGDRWAARTTWWYWINVAGFVPYTLVVMGSALQLLFFPDLSVWEMVLFCVICTWIVVGFNCIDLKNSKWLSTISTVCKLVACLALIAGAIYVLITKGSQTIFSWSTIIPTFDLSFLALVPVYVYALTGYDLISVSAGEMKNPSRDVPKAVFSSGITTIILYIISAVAMLIIMPAAEIDPDSGLFEAFGKIFGNVSVTIVGLISFVALLGYIFSWSLAGNKATLEAGLEGELPKIFAKTNRAYAPVGPAILLGLSSTALLLFYGFISTSNASLFWTLLSFTSIIFFLPYIVLSFAYIKLRKMDPDINRPFKIPGKPWVGTMFALIQFIFFAFSAVFFLIPPEGENPISYILFLIIGVLAAVICGEIIIDRQLKKKSAHK